jgi:hypothetical protein
MSTRSDFLPKIGGTAACDDVRRTLLRFRIHDGIKR